MRKKGGKVLNVITAPKKKAASVAAAKALNLLKPSTSPAADKGKKKGGKKLKVSTVSKARDNLEANTCSINVLKFQTLYSILPYLILPKFCFLCSCFFKY